MPDTNHDDADGRQGDGLTQVSFELRNQAMALQSALLQTAELHESAERESDRERALSALRERQLAVLEVVLDCLRSQQAAGDRMLESLVDQQALTRHALDQVNRLHERLDALSDRVDRPGASRAAGVDVPPAEASESTRQAAEQEVNATRAPVRHPVLGRIAAPLSRAPRACAVCRRDAPGRTKRDLADAGWTAAGNRAICPGCLETGWRLGSKGGLPYRRRVGGA